MSKRIQESDLVLPALFCLYSSGSKYLSTTDLIDNLRLILKPTGADLEILAGRTDDKFSQKVRNLKSHDTLAKDKLASHVTDGFKILSEGQKYLLSNADLTNYLLTNDFKYDDIKNSFKSTHDNRNKRTPEAFDENIFINEGMKRIVSQAVYTRSAKLRDLAIEKYTVGGRISCSVCSFNFKDFYGPKLGANYIEIHHTKPVFKYQDEDLKKYLDDALKNVIPVCSNCHRVIHRNRNEFVPLASIKSTISKHGIWPK